VQWTVCLIKMESNVVFRLAMYVAIRQKGQVSILTLEECKFWR